MLKRKGSTNRAISWLLRIVLVGGIAAVAFLPPLSTLNRQRDTASITTFDASMVLSSDGHLSSDERITVSMPSGKHGIFRIFDTADPRRSNVDHPVTVDSVTRDGSPEPYEVVPSPSGTKSLKIGSAAVTLSPGTHQYQIQSSTTDVLEPGAKDQTLWWWDVVGSGWQMGMESVDISVQLPARPLKTECVQGDDTKCTASVEGTSLRIRTGPLEPFTPVTVRVTFPEDAVGTPIQPSSNAALFIALAIVGGILAVGAAFLLVSRTRENEPGFPVLYEPPAGIYPALGVRVLDETDSDNDLQATLFDLAERGVLTLAGDDDSWSVTAVANPAESNLRQAEISVLGALGLGHKGASFQVSATKGAGERISTAKKALRSTVSVDSRSYLSQSTAGWALMALGWLALIASVAQIVVYFVSDTGFIFWPLLVTTSAFALVAMGAMFNRGVLTKRTEPGMDIWSRTGGFARFLTTDSSESRFEAAKHLDLYPRYLPWALALGSADAWAQRYQEQGVDLPVVPWLIWSGAAHNFSMTSMNNSFNSAISSAAAAYAASQASSGGGGFSGGSGGGGGGGGSW